MVRSTVLGAAKSVSAGQTISLGTVPATGTWIVKNFAFANFSGLSANCHLRFNRGGGSQFGYVALVSLGTNGALSQDVFVVGSPGDTLEFFVDQANVHCWVSGAALAGHA